MRNHSECSDVRQDLISNRPNSGVSPAAAATIASTPEDLGADLERRIAVARAQEQQGELLHSNRCGYVRHKLPFDQYRDLQAAINAATEQAQAQAAGQLVLEKPLTDAEAALVITPALVPLGEGRPLGRQKKRRQCALDIYALLRMWSASTGCQLVVTSRTILQRQIEQQLGRSYSLGTIDLARPLLAFLGCPLFEIDHDHSGYSRGVATILPGLPSRAALQQSPPLSPSHAREEASRPQEEQLFLTEPEIDLSNPHGPSGHTKALSNTNPDGTRDETDSRATAEPFPWPKAPGGQRVTGDWRVDDCLPRSVGPQACMEFWLRFPALGDPKFSHRRHGPAFRAAAGRLERHLGVAGTYRFIYELIERAAAGGVLSPRHTSPPRSLAALIPAIRHEARCQRRRRELDRDAQLLANFTAAGEDLRSSFDQLLSEHVATADVDLQLVGISRGHVGPDGRVRQGRSGLRAGGGIAVLRGDIEAWRRLTRGAEAFDVVFNICEALGFQAFTVSGQRQIYLTEVLTRSGLWYGGQRFRGDASTSAESDESAQLPANDLSTEDSRDVLGESLTSCQLDRALGLLLRAELGEDFVDGQLSGCWHGTWRRAYVLGFVNQPDHAWVSLRYGAVLDRLARRRGYSGLKLVLGAPPEAR